MSGFYMMRRGWLDDEMFQSPQREPFCHRAAWAWLIEHAAYQPVSVQYHGKDHTLERGQMVCSLLDMGGAWGWNTTKVARCLTALRLRGLIVTSAVTVGTLITICFYDDYQSLEKPTVTATVTPPAVTVKRDRYGLRKEGNESEASEAKASSGSIARDQAQSMASVWQQECGDILSVPQKLDAKRIAGCNARWGDSFGRDIAKWVGYCRAIRALPFCCGDNDRGWRADFDWALTPKAIRSVQEGKYERRPAPASGQIIEGRWGSAETTRGGQGDSKIHAALRGVRVN